VQDEKLRKAVTPDYDPGCKRLLVSDDFFPALRRPNVQVAAIPAAGAVRRGQMGRAG
jgi:cation diffusion facilitator CzcD-associated flavoprotein CzcO